MLRMIFIAPIIQLFLLGYAISTDVKYVYMGVYDYDRSALSRDLVRSMGVGDYFVPSAGPAPLPQSERNLLSGEKNVNLIIPPGFSKDLLTSQPAPVGLVADGSNANSASIAIGYANLISNQFDRRRLDVSTPLVLRQKTLYNPEGESVYFIVPGIVATLLTK